MGPFDYVNSITTSKKNLIVDALTEKDYLPFIVNRALSYHLDCVFQANEMNGRHFLSKISQYNYLLNTIRARKRYPSKWHKLESNENLELIMVYYGYSRAKAREVLDLLSASDLEQIRKMTDEGGL